LNSERDSLKNTLVPETHGLEFYYAYSYLIFIRIYEKFIINLLLFCQWDLFCIKMDFYKFYRKMSCHSTNKIGYRSNRTIGRNVVEKDFGEVQ
jgi:hypothetical protein